MQSLPTCLNTLLRVGTHCCCPVCTQEGSEQHTLERHSQEEQSRLLLLLLERS